MSNEIWIALVPALASIVAAVFAWIQAVKSARVSASATLVSEQARRDAERKREAFRIATEETRPVSEALDRAWHDIQTGKDAITDLLGGDKREVMHASQQLISAAKSLETHYREFGSRVPLPAKDAWYGARNVLGSFAASVDAGFMTRLEASEHEDFLAALAEGRLSLTDAQMILANERHRLREQSAAQIADLL